MQYLPTRGIDVPYKGAPLTAQDIIKERVNFEDRVLAHAQAHNTIIPPSKRIALPKLKLTEAAKVAFGAQIRRVAMSVINV